MPKQVKELDKQEALDLVKRRFNIARQSSALDFERFARYYKLVRNRQTKKNYNGLADLFVPEPYRIIRNKTARLANAIRNIHVTAESANDVEAARVSSQLLNFLRRKLNWHIEERSAIQESRIVGLSWIKCLWNIDKEEEDKPYKGFDLNMQTADRILLSPGTTILDVFKGDVPWLIHNYEADLATLKKNPSTTTDKPLRKSPCATKCQSPLNSPCPILGT